MFYALNQKHSPIHFTPLQALELYLKPLIFRGGLTFETPGGTSYEESDASFSKHFHLAFPLFLQQK